MYMLLNFVGGSHRIGARLNPGDQSLTSIQSFLSQDTMYCFFSLSSVGTSYMAVDSCCDRIKLKSSRPTSPSLTYAQREKYDVQVPGHP